MIQAASNIIERDIPIITDFVRRQLEGVAEFAKMIAVGIQEETIRKESRDFFLKGLKDKPGDLKEALTEIFKAEIAKAWNAMVGVLWTAIETAIGFKLPIPS